MKTKKRRRQAPDPAYTPEALFNEISGGVHGGLTRAAGYLRFSIKLRIALGHILLLFRGLPLAAILLIVALGIAYAPVYRDRLLQSMETIGRPPREESLSLPQWDVEGLLLTEAGVVYAGNVPGAAYWPPLPVWAAWGVTWDTQAHRLYLTHQEDGLMLLISLRDAQHLLLILLFFLGGLWAFWSLSILTRGQRLSAALLSPIQDISNMAQNLSEKNLSERINIEGTQNELRDLAMMVNAMLDRIEAAYNRQKQFVSDASHELRTPISVLQGYADLLNRWGKDAPDVRDEAIAAILNETQSMKVLVESLLFLARHDKNTLQLETQPFSAAELVRETIKETELIARNHRVETGPTEDCTLLADRSAIKQALRIFVDNAIKYTPKGGFISISSQVAGGMCRISIRDTGQGIRKEDLPRIFDRFYRADQARSSVNVSGHGLGLSIARIIASSHRGRIHVRSKPGQGSTFTLALPL